MIYAPFRQPYPARTDKGRLKQLTPAAAFCVSRILRRIARPNGASPR